MNHPALQGGVIHIVTQEKLHRLIDMVVYECASFVHLEIQHNQDNQQVNMVDALQEYFKTEFSQD